MDVVETLERPKSIEWIDEDGGRKDSSFLPGFPAGTIDRLEESFGAPLPEDYRTLVMHCRGIKGAVIDFKFRGFEDDFWVEDILPHGMPFAHDGFGNYWVVDCCRTREPLSHLFYTCHDAPVLLYQGTGIAGFLGSLPAYDKGDRESAIWKVWDDAVWEIWSGNPGLLTLTEALVSPYSALREFAEEIAEPCHIVDLRDVSVGMEFPRGRYGLDTPIRRFGEKRIFVYKPPDRP